MQAFFIGHQKTPKSVRILILATCLVSLLSPVATYFLHFFFNLPGPLEWFALSLSKIKQGWIWQPLTFFFLNSYSTAVTLSLFFSLFFLMLILWFAGSEVDFRFGPRNFILFYLSSGTFAGIVSLIFLFFANSTQIIVGSSPPVFATVLLFAMLYPNLELYFFFFLRVKAKWIAALLLGFSFLMSLSAGQFISFAAELAAVVWSFCIGRFFWKLPNPYPIPFRFPKRKSGSKDKIIDISVFQEDDDAFMDRMLDKIAKKGKDSLTKREKERMDKISEKKKKF